MKYGFIVIYMSWYRDLWPDIPPIKVMIAVTESILDLLFTQQDSVLG